VREAGDLLGHLHLQDSDGNVDRHWAPGTGLMPWHALFEALGTLRHRPRLILELKKTGELRRAAAWLAERGLAR
jgi:sugar phosphate isomerase/epimerase